MNGLQNVVGIVGALESIYYFDRRKGVKQSISAQEVVGLQQVVRLRLL